MGPEIKKSRETCKYFMKERDIRGLPVTFCVATGKPRCTYGDPHGFAHCPNYLRYGKSVEELTPKTATAPRFPS